MNFNQESRCPSKACPIRILHIDSDFEIYFCDPLLQSTSSVQNLSSQDQNLRFIHLVWIPLGLFSRLHQGFPFKVQMNSHKCVLNLKLHWVTSSIYHSCSVPTILIHHSYQKFSIAILNYPSTALRLSAINRKVGFIKKSSRKTHWIMKWRFAFFKFSSPPSYSHFSPWPYHSQHLATNIAS